MTIKLKTIGLMLIFLILATCVLIVVSLVADRLAEVSKSDGYNIVITDDLPAGAMPCADCQP